MTIMLTAEERDALYEELYVGLTGIDGVWVAASSGDYEEAQRLAQQYYDDLRLLVDHVGWGEGGEGGLELTAPPDVLRRVFTRLRGAAEAQREEAEGDRLEAQEREDQAQRLLDTCKRVLGEVGG